MLSVESIVKAYRFMREHDGEADVPEHLRGPLNAEGSAGGSPSRIRWVLVAMSRRSPGGGENPLTDGREGCLRT